MGEESAATGVGPPAPGASAEAVFGPRLDLAVEYVRMLATDGVRRGLIGPREVPRLWDRHLLNCAVASELVPAKAGVIDVGSGAGLPGIPLALARPDLRVTLLEPMARRCTFLQEVVEHLKLDSVEVFRGRAQDIVGERPAAGAPADVVTARAVAPLGSLAAWCLPLVRIDGVLLAIKGATAAEELSAAATAVRAAGGIRPRVRRCGMGLVDPVTTVVEIVRGFGPRTRGGAR